MSESLFDSLVDDPWNRYLRILDQNFERYLLIVLYFYITFAIVIAVINRYVFGFSIVWTNESAIFMYIYLSWIGASWGVRKRVHIRVDLIHEYLSERSRGLLFILSDLALLVFIYFTLVGFQPVWNNAVEFGASVQSMRLSQLYFIAAIPIGFGLMTIRTVQMLTIDLHSVLTDGPVYEGVGLMGETD